MIWFVVISSVCLCLAIICLWLLKTKRMTLPFFYKYTEGYTIGVVKTRNPLEINIPQIHILEKKQFGMHPQPTIMADPFVVKENDKYYIFYEELSGKHRNLGGNIAVLESTDFVHWHRIGVVLKEPFHLSFPNVFSWKGVWYMLPEASASQELRLYCSTQFPCKWNLYKVLHSESFPTKWNLCKVLMTDVRYADPMIMEKDGVWYLWLNLFGKEDSLRLYIADDLLGEWREHPQSPIRVNEMDTRPAGRVSKINEEWYYFVQEHIGGYGTGIIAYKILTLTPTEFEDKRLECNPILYKNGNDWAKNGMHHLSFIEEDGQYACVTDGLLGDRGWRWRIDLFNFPQFSSLKCKR